MKPSDKTTIRVSGIVDHLVAGQCLTVGIALEICGLCIFDPVLRVFIRRAGEEAHLVSADTHQGQFFFPWLPCGIYEFDFVWPISLPSGSYELGVAWGSPCEIRKPDFLQGFRITDATQPVASVLNGTWRLHPDSQQRIAALSWQKGMTNWFHRHFYHAAVVIGDSFLARSPLLKGRILDIGAGEGITDLGLFLRYQPQELVAMDIVDYLKHLPAIAQQNDLSLKDFPEGFTFVQGSCETIPYAGSSFDVVISWGSLEHIAGGYRRTLDEVWRVLKPGGLFFVNPGLYYSSYGSHLGEFNEEPHLHLKINEDRLRDMVMNTSPRIIDRAGFDVSNANYWRFYKELNRIRVAEFETELKEYGYTIVRAAIRANDMVEYTPELQSYSITDLATEDVFFTLHKPD